jgi:hypothetical protein
MIRGNYYFNINAECILFFSSLASLQLPPTTLPSFKAKACLATIKMYVPIGFSLTKVFKVICLSTISPQFLYRVINLYGLLGNTLQGSPSSTIFFPSTSVCSFSLRDVSTVPCLGFLLKTSATYL